MSNSKRKIISAAGLCLCVILLWAGAYLVPELNTSEEKAQKEKKEHTQQALSYDDAEKEVVFWYSDADCAAFAEACVRDYYDKTGVAVAAVYREPQGYLEQIYDASMEDEDFPDIYLTWNDAQEKAYLYGVATDEAYPVYFNTMLMVYRTDCFPNAPGSVQEILDFGQSNELGEGVGSLLEWNVADGFCNYPFVGDSILAQEDGTYAVEDEEKYKQELTFFQLLSESVGLEPDTITREVVLEHFNQGATLTAFVDSDDLKRITVEGYGVAALPKLNGELDMRGCARTGVLLINEFSERDVKEKAREFAAFVAEQEAESLAELTPHISVDVTSLKNPWDIVAYEQYRNSDEAPSFVREEAFWSRFTNDMTGFWNGEALPE